MRKLILAMTFAGLAGAATAAPVNSSYSSFWALGDSLSDNGNLNWLAYGLGTNWNYSGQTGTNDYYTGRFTNGKVWTEYVAAEFKSAGLTTGNLARGGSEAAEPNSWFDVTPGLQWQREKLVSSYGGRFGDSPLVSLLAGANDVFDAIGKSNAVDTARKAADAVAASARYLFGKGVSDFLIGNLPDLARVPRYALFDTGLKTAAHDASLAFNSRLASNIAGLRSQGMRVTTLDLWGLMGDLIDRPGAYGLSNVTLPCVFPNATAAGAAGQPLECSAANAKNRLFFDWVHPNLRAHQIMGERVISMLTADPAQTQLRLAAMSTAGDATIMIAPVPLPASAMMMLAGLGLMMLIRRRRVI